MLVSGALGLATFLVVNGLGEFFDTDDEAETELEERERGGNAAAVVGAAGKAAFFLFLYLEVLDASFSFDGVVGAFAITSDPIIIAIGLGVGAMFIRSLTVFLVRKGTLSEYVYLEHGALWAIGALAVLLLITIEYEVPEVVTGLIGVGFIGAAFISSVVRNKRVGGEPKSTSRNVTRRNRRRSDAHRLHETTQPASRAGPSAPSAARAPPARSC